MIALVPQRDFYPILKSISTSVFFLILYNFPSREYWKKKSIFDFFAESPT